MVLFDLLDQLFKFGYFSMSQMRSRAFDYQALSYSKFRSLANQK